MKHAFAALMLVVLFPGVLFLGACAPIPMQEAPAEPSAEPRTGDLERTDPASPETAKPEPEPADPISDAEPATEATESTDEPIDEPTADTQAQPEDRDAPEPAAAQAESADAATPRAAAKAELSGRITLTGGDADPEEAVVYFVPRAADQASSRPGSPESAEIVTRDKSLAPTVLSVSSGSEIRFPNEDPILHNLFSVSAGNDFDLGVYGPGEAPSVKLEQAGVVNIYCNVHHDMHAHVLVVDTPFRTRADSNGNFRLSNLPAGPGELHIWHRQSDRWSRPVELPADGSIEATLNVSKPRLPPHRDKTGQSYNRRDRDPYR